MMFSESHNERRRLIGGRRVQLSPQGSVTTPQKSATTPRNRRWRRRDRRYRRERDPMLNSVLNGDWSNSVPGRKIPEGCTAVVKLNHIKSTSQSPWLHQHLLPVEPTLIPLSHTEGTMVFPPIFQLKLLAKSYT